MIRHVLVFIWFSIFLTGCYAGGIIDASYEAPSPKTGYFYTAFKVPNDEILVNKQINLNAYRKLLVIGIKNYAFVSSSEDEAYWQKAIQSMGIFDNVVPISNLYGFAADNGYADNVPTQFIDDEDIAKLEKVYGKFLLLEITNTVEGYTNNVITLKVTDPETGVVCFEIRRSQFVVTTYSQQLYYPVMNSLKDWLDAQATQR